MASYAFSVCEFRLPPGRLGAMVKNFRFFRGGEWGRLGGSEVLNYDTALTSILFISETVKAYLQLRLAYNARLPILLQPSFSQILFLY